jgi:hypothetical protein
MTHPRRAGLGARETGMRTYTVMATGLGGTYTAGTYQAESAEDACEAARSDYAASQAGREMRDVGAFRFWVAE